VAGKVFATLWDDTHMNVMLDADGIGAAVPGGRRRAEDGPGPDPGPDPPPATWHSCGWADLPSKLAGKR
jgi:hypothetical protein